MRRSQKGHRLNPHERANDYQRYSMLIALPLRSMSSIFGNSSSFQAADDDQFSVIYFFPLSAKKGFLKIFRVSDDDKYYGENMS